MNLTFIYSLLSTLLPSTSKYWGLREVLSQLCVGDWLHMELQNHYTHQTHQLVNMETNSLL